MEKNNICPVCGYQLKEPAWFDSKSASFEVCPCCGIQFGYIDAAGGDVDKRLEIYKNWRLDWIKRGMPWESIGIITPENWDPKIQLKNISEVNE